MEQLRKYFEMPGFENITTYIQSGNVLFDAEATDTALLVNIIESELASKLGYHVPVVVRSISQIEGIINNNPFPQWQEEAGKSLYVQLLSATPAPGAAALLQPYCNADEQIACIGQEIYFLTIKFGNTKLTNTVIEKKLGVAATARNWATVNKVAQL